uniref:H15 domain-containing protein n=1 Tax=Salix viminalis TaxID=40686 RepID=A0A6N2N061_SALVM
MEDGTRISQLADSLASVKTNQDQSQKHLNALQEIVQGLAQKLDVVASHVEALVQVKAAQNLGEPGSSTQQITNPLFEENVGIQTRSVRLDFPRFSGDNPSGWDLEAAGGLSSWEGFVRALQTRFGSSPYDDPMEALIRLRQTTTVEEYKTQFEALSNQLRGLAESYKLSCFLNGLREDIRCMVRMLNPPNLHLAFGLAKMQEENVAALRRSTKSGPMPIRDTIGPMNLQEKRTLVPIQRLNPWQMRERREKGLCYNCDEKWGLGHKCKAARLFVMEGEDADGEGMLTTAITDDSLMEVLADGVEPEISIHALCGSPNPKTMRFVGYIGKRAVVILVDTGSTHNFVDPSVIKRAQLPYNNQELLRVKVANGQTESSEGSIAAVALLMQGHVYAIDFYVLTLEGCDIVLGIHWLRTLDQFYGISPNYKWSSQFLTDPVSYKGQNFCKATRQNEKELVIQLIDYEYAELWFIDSPRNTLIHNLRNKFSDIFTTMIQELENTFKSRDEPYKQQSVVQRHNMKLSPPPYFKMITEAITTLKDRKGSSQPAIARFIEEKYKKSSLPSNFKKVLSVQLKKFVKFERLVKRKNSYKISSTEKLQLGIKKTQKKKGSYREDIIERCPDKEDIIRPEPEEGLSTKMQKKKNGVVSEIWFKWKGLGAEEASWGKYSRRVKEFPDLVGKVF